MKVDLDTAMVNVPRQLNEQDNKVNAKYQQMEDW